MPSALELQEGQVFAGQFRVLRPLAQGGMGAVYVVEQLSTGKKRALKLMLPSAAVVDGTRRFEQEARTSSLIPSEHVVDVIAAGVEGPERVPWLAMELLEGESLESYLDRIGPLSPGQAYEILAQLCHCLSAAHELGVVHRDLKPDNIFLAHARSASSEFMVKVLDFGLATVLEPNSRNTTALGSPLWMAPEQTQTNEPISLGTDVWAIGLIVFRMLSGRHYWRAVDGSLGSLLREVVIDPLPAASARSRELGGAELPAGFDEWFEQCVVRFPAYRFDHARSAWEALQPVLIAAGATPHAQRARSEHPPAPVPRRADGEPPTEKISGITGLNASKTLLSPSGSALGAASNPELDATATRPNSKSRRRLLSGLALLALLGTAAALWSKRSTLAASERSSPLADTVSAAVPPAAPAPVASLPAVAPRAPDALDASAPLPKLAAPEPIVAVPSARAQANRPALKPERPARPVASTQPEKPPTLPDLL
jgi:serine/threonine protein kinase